MVLGCGGAGRVEPPLYAYMYTIIYDDVNSAAPKGAKAYGTMF